MRLCAPSCLALALVVALAVPSAAALPCLSFNCVADHILRAVGVNEQACPGLGPCLPATACVSLACDEYAVDSHVAPVDNLAQGLAGCPVSGGGDPFGDVIDFNPSGVVNHAPACLP
jgi:hypothetical protein